MPVNVLCIVRLYFDLFKIDQFPPRGVVGVLTPEEEAGATNSHLSTRNQ